MYMKLIRTNHAAKELVEHFLMNNPEINKATLLANGYVVKVENKIAGCFILERLEDRLYWLKQLYITKAEAVKLPLLVESILALAKEQHAEEVFVNSHQIMVDIILEALQFHPQKDLTILDKHFTSEGKWWTYRITG